MSTAGRRRPVRAAPRRPAAPPLLGGLLRVGWQQVRRQMADDIEAAGFTDLQDAHLSVFQYPGPEGLRPSGLARQLHISRQAANHLIAQLEALGYLERRVEAAGDRRRLYLTDRGRRLTTTIRSSVRRFEADVARSEGSTRFAVFLEVLRKITTRRSTRRPR